MKRRERTVEGASRPCAIKVNDSAAAREMRDAVNCSSLKGCHDRRRQVLRRNSAIDLDSVDLDALKRHRCSEIPGAILACQIEYPITPAIAAANQVCQRLFVALSRGDVGEANRARGFCGAAANRQHRQRDKLVAPRMLLKRMRCV